ncbi:unnamed protein product [Candida parapsilosis]|uniref:DUF1765-domain-containing protein n=1 Tax=Candida parapsilosis (strain CDC 317 / ATCC MYA-4646) TaxID=578454 RepID=G8BAW3_CANPC|nr:uncharacterized protein CPAR2_807360 [Candida parapsilosis]KAI5902324.1 uncharacterized protein K4G60_g1464 [Candida parapsilosis]KAI5906694.1 uncharacterized protein K4G61_g353 [Candida parapsilosis]CAD1811103.1 unnamed protein product [Candida parapsilosis]CCE42187.1 hypothetical protein CPAR2_807360 [Candida parapsilosis]
MTNVLSRSLAARGESNIGATNDENDDLSTESTPSKTITKSKSFISRKFSSNSLFAQANSQSSFSQSPPPPPPKPAAVSISSPSKLLRSSPVPRQKSAIASSSSSSSSLNASTSTLQPSPKTKASPKVPALQQPPPLTPPSAGYRLPRSGSSFVSLSSYSSIPSASSVSTTASNNSNGNSSNNTNNDKLIQTLLKRYKKLELALNKFNSKKYNHNSNGTKTVNGSIMKGNLLRTSLIPFLRSANQLDQFFAKDSKVYKSLTCVVLAILIKWWNALIGNLRYTANLSATASTTSATTSSNSKSPSSHTLSHSILSSVEPIHFTSIPASDRNAYLECVSRIISRDDWIYYDEFSDYQILLTTTLDFCIDKLTTLKTLSGPMAAFIGKVFAFSFFKLPNVSTALLFLLNVKQITLETCTKSLPNTSTHDSRELFNVFPQHLHHLIDFKGLPNLEDRGQKCFMNCTPPPKHPVDGIKNPNGDWVRRWCGSDSSVFNSFLRHYIEIVQKSLLPIIDDDVMILLKCPGFSVILSHVYQIFHIAITRITSSSKPNFTTAGGSVTKSAPLPPIPAMANRKRENDDCGNGGGAPAPAPASASAVPPPSPPPPHTTFSSNGQRCKAPAPPPPPQFNINIKQSDMYYNSIIKIFKTVRDVIYCATLDNKSIDCISASLVKVIDLCLISIAKEVTIYDFNKNGLILGIVHEFINHVENNISNEVKYLISWEFWLSCNYMMMSHSDHVQSLLKNFQFLFNVWDMIPDALCSFVQPQRSEYGPIGDIHDENYKWITNVEDSFKLNFTNYLISDDMFRTMFVHWNPLVRSYYIKFLVWRVIGINNSQSSASIQVTRNLQFKLDQSFDALQRYTMKLCNEHKPKEYSETSDVTCRPMFTLNFKPDNPLVNRKFGILPASVRDDYLSIGNNGSYDSQQSDMFQTSTAVTSVSKSSELRKTHAFEIFDEAIYTCATVAPASNGSNTPREDEKRNGSSSSGSVASSFGSKGTSLVSSIGRLLRIVADAGDGDGEDKDDGSDDKFVDPKETLAKHSGNGNINANDITRNSESSTSLSTTNSFKSRSSSPSIMSFRSTPTSFTESSSAKSDNESIYSLDTIKLNGPLQDASFGAQQRMQQQSGHGKSLTKKKSSQLYNIQPPELARLPPEIVRPIFKFDIIVCHESINEKFQIINHKNALVRQQLFYNSDGHLPSMSSRTTTATNASFSSTSTGSGSNMGSSIKSSVLYFPHHPQLPYISIFINSDLYNNKIVYMNEEEDGIFLEQFHPQDVLTSATDSTSATTSQSDHMRTATASRSTPSRQNLRSATMFPYESSSMTTMINLGKSMNEMNIIIDGFRKYLSKRIEADAFYSNAGYDFNEDGDKLGSANIGFPVFSGGIEEENDEGGGESSGVRSFTVKGKDFNEFVYFKRIIPFLSVDSSNEMKLLNAS